MAAKIRKPRRAFVEESPHWLLAKGRVDEAHRVLWKILGAWNKRTDLTESAVRRVVNDEQARQQVGI